jgi:16S rRNA (guanine527-N7)-methyltransferase
MDPLRPSHRQRLSRQCEHHGLALSAAQLARLGQYVELLLHWRRYINLTGLREAERIIDVLIAESLDFLQRDVLPPAARVLDLGTGAGVPGIPLAIVAPDLHLTLLDRSEKKITFLRRVVALLHLDNCQPICSSAEQLAPRLSPCERFDAVVTRGVGRVVHLLSLARPLLRPGGILLLRKPPDTAELQEAAPLLTAGAWGEIQTRCVSTQAASPWVLFMIFRSAAAEG